MGAKPLAEAYEKLKELRRHPSYLTWESVLHELAGTISAPEVEKTAETSDQTGRLIRLLEIKPLAERIFGDETKADAWLNRANPSFSGQKPIDLLRDELGTAVVREALEQIDHGIFS